MNITYMNKIIIWLVPILIIFAGSIYILNVNNSMNDNAVIPGNVHNDEDATADAQPNNTKTFDINGSNFQFSTKEIRVHKGDKVRINFRSLEGFHDWRVDEFQAATRKIQAGDQDTIEFIADQAGSFEYYCSVGNHRQMGMVGTLVVEDN